MTAPGSSELAEKDHALSTEVAGLAPELEGAKKGQGESPLTSASERDRKSVV